MQRIRHHGPLPQPPHPNAGSSRVRRPMVRFPYCCENSQGIGWSCCFSCFSSSLLTTSLNLAILHPPPPLLRKRQRRCRSLKSSDEIPVWLFVFVNKIKRLFVHTAIALVFLSNLDTPPHINLTWFTLLWCVQYIYTFVGYRYYPRNPPLLASA